MLVQDEGCKEADTFAGTLFSISLSQTEKKENYKVHINLDLQSFFFTDARDTRSDTSHSTMMRLCLSCFKKMGMTRCRCCCSCRWWCWRAMNLEKCWLGCKKLINQPLIILNCKLRFLRSCLKTIIIWHPWVKHVSCGRAHISCSILVFILLLVTELLKLLHSIDK